MAVTDTLTIYNPAWLEKHGFYQPSEAAMTEIVCAAGSLQCDVDGFDPNMHGDILAL